jgi:predicted CopG family antitoxin
MAITGATVNDQYYTELLALTREELSTSDVVDQVLTRNPSLELFREAGKSMSGAFLSTNIVTARHGRTAVATDKSGTYDTAVDSDLSGRAVYYVPNFRITPCRVKAYDIEINKGSNRIVDLAKFHLKQAQEDMAQNTADILHTSAQVAGGTVVTGDLDTPPDAAFGLDYICGGVVQSYTAATDSWAFAGATFDFNPTGAAASSELTFKFGGIAPDDENHYWTATRAQASPLSTDASYLPIVEHMRHVLDEIYSKTRSYPTHIIMSRSVWKEYRASFDDNKRFPDPVDNKGDHEFPEYQFEGLPIGVRFDPDIPESVGDEGRFYCLTKSDLLFRWQNDLWMKVWEEDQIQGTLDKIVPIVSQYTIGSERRNSQGVGLRVKE